VADGLVDGLRIDHIDGLLEPRRYLERLREAVDARRPASAGGMRFPIVVEKILAPGETLPADWPVEGTTGYEFMTTLEDVFIDPVGYAQLEERYRRGRDEPGFHAVAYASKRAVLRKTLNADVRRIAPMLATLARRAKWPAKSIAAYAGAIVELVAALPVYRTYMDAERPEAEGSDREMLERAFTEARERGHADGDALDALDRALLGAWRGEAPELARARLAFVLRLQQLTGPAAAKGVEDTALYVYAPLASRNEVGGDPAVPVVWGYSVARDEHEFVAQFRALMDTVIHTALFSGFCYTQFADTFQEANGLLCADRTPKIPLDLIAEWTTVSPTHIRGVV
jgi:(1->4)-alpha-D-glucan 1-alpha-D-glucosylmutase